MSLEDINTDVRTNIKVEIAKRISNWKTGEAIWDGWTDVTEYFMSIVTDYNFSIDDNTLTGKYSQESINLKFSNEAGTFNSEEVEGSLWRSGEYIYHSRLRIYEWSENTAEPTAYNLVIDGLISEYAPTYYLNGDCNLMVNSKLDILRDHFLVTEDNSKSNVASSQGILNYIIRLYDTYYSELGVEFKGCIFYNNVDFDNLGAYGKNLLDLFLESIDSGGGYGGMINNVFFSSFVGAPEITGTNFTATNFPISVWTFKEGTGTTVADDLSTNTLTVDLGTTLIPIDTPWKDGLFDSSARNFLLYSNSGIFSQITTACSVEMLITIDKNKLFPTSLPLVFGASSTEQGLYPLVAWSNDGVTAATVLVNFDTGYQLEGFFIDNLYKVYYGIGTVSGNSFTFTFREELGQLDTDNMYQYLGFSQTVDGDVAFYKNGRFVNGFRYNDIALPLKAGAVLFDAAKRKRFVGYGYFNRLNGATVNKYPETCAVYYNGLKVNYQELSDDVVFDTYLSLFSRSTI